ncbi:methyl-accepting chemotaxis protein [Vreelandella populi]|uniref:Methyl-accepting chemotaxis protein n=1 Tax=Vreelandella populi TaxID=2498858 RepID=A0A433L7P9_9GAMM|nr:methyl-accepting chemotaxis protein [Halomonas populi]RUR38598.1 methyl-accepting chemotaxis protein [Halomonas populi]RUR43309.1 methyl-accepting chemotaxis protein [Halomonas populi]RUR51670.1 methyl-accepting chemotaxis protein [Halomonas populi]
MRLLGLLVPFVLLGLAVELVSQTNALKYLALISASLAGAGFIGNTLLGIYMADQQRLGRVRGFKPLRDYASLKAMAYRLMKRASSTAIASAEVSHYADLMDQRLAKQETMAREASSSMSAINTAILQVSASASQVASLAESARQAGHHNCDELADIICDMSDVAERSDQALEMLTALNEKIERVRNVTSMIEGIAEQTHLLSLNASIEAVRAGEHGRGFAVVAGEVRSLALKTSTATQSVELLVKDMHQSGQQVVMTMGSLMARIRERSQGMHQVGESLGTITREFDQVQREITGVAKSMASTKAHSQTVADSLHQLEMDVDEGTRNMHDLAAQALALMEAAEGVDGELAQQRLQGRHQQVFNAARQAADEIGKLFEKAIARGDLTASALFEPDFKAIPDTQPPLYRTGFDAFTDKHLPDLQEPLLTQYGLSYAIVCDRHGYVPTHNAAVSQQPTGDYQHDLKYCRSKRIFDDTTGNRCGTHTKPLLLQTYKRDTGEIMHDLSVPIYIHGKHWGGFRVGYQPERSSASNQAGLKVSDHDLNAPLGNRLARA